MFCVDRRDEGFGTAMMMSAVGSFTTNDAILDVMTHELGHELGLNHDGYQPHNCPIYPSLMSYTYQDRLNGRADWKQLSSGALGSILLDERRLSERLPVPIERVRFLANEPYFYQLRPAGGSTLVDWNWNGIFGEEGVVADINYSHFTDIGRRRYEIGSSETAPALATVGDGTAQRLLLFSGTVRGNSPRPAPDAPAFVASLGPERPGAIVVREWLGDDRDRDGERWSAETVVEANGVIGDPTAVSFGGGVLGRLPHGGRGSPAAGGTRTSGRRNPPDRRASSDRAKQWGGPLTFRPWRWTGPLSLARDRSARRRPATRAHCDRARDGPGARAADRQCRTRRRCGRPHAWPIPERLGRVNRRTRPTPSPGGNPPLCLRGRRPRAVSRRRVERGRRILVRPAPIGPALAPRTRARCRANLRFRGRSVLG